MTTRHQILRQIAAKNEEAGCAKPEITENTVFTVGVSGGKDSSAALLWMVHESGIPRHQIIATFCDIGNDHEWTLDHVKMLSEKVHPIETLKPELDFFELARKKRRFPSTKARFCTEHLKIHPTQDHIIRLVQSGKKPIAVSGVRADESDARSKKLEWDFSGMLLCHEWRPLIRWTIKDVIAIHEKYGVPLNPLYAIGAQRVGCWPCIMSRKAEIRTIATMFPERIEQLAKAEEAFETEFGRGSTFFVQNMTPKRFHSKSAVNKKGKRITFGTARDVARWALTGKRAKGSHTDNDPTLFNWAGLKTGPVTCKSGYCE